MEGILMKPIDKVTIYDIAEATNLSIATISRVINKKRALFSCN